MCGAPVTDVGGAPPLRDEEEDGEWEAPMVPNPACEEVGCGTWEPAMIKNPAYKGRWTPSLINNPDYSVRHDVWGSGRREPL